MRVIRSHTSSSLCLMKASTSRGRPKGGGVAFICAQFNKNTFYTYCNYGFYRDISAMMVSVGRVLCVDYLLSTSSKHSHWWLKYFWDIFKNKSCFTPIQSGQ
jgi:hypothetical protein